MEQVLKEFLEYLFLGLEVGAISRVIFYEDGSGMVETEGVEIYEFRNVRELLDLQGDIFQCVMCGDDFVHTQLVVVGNGLVCDACREEK